MKKLLAIALIATSFVACNDAETKTEENAVDTTTVVAPVAEPVVELTPAPTETHTTTSEEYTVKGKTTFGELITWGVPQEVIEQLIGAPMPDPAVTVKDYASANGLNFETLKPAMQAEVDKVKK